MSSLPVKHLAEENLLEVNEAPKRSTPVLMAVDTSTDMSTYQPNSRLERFFMNFGKMITPHHNESGTAYMRNMEFLLQHLKMY